MTFNEIILPMIGKSKKPAWWVWVLGRPNHLELGRQPKYFLGTVQGTEEEAVKEAKRRWPKHVGSMEVEEVPTEEHFKRP